MYCTSFIREQSIFMISPPRSLCISNPQSTPKCALPFFPLPFSLGWWLRSNGDPLANPAVNLAANTMAYLTTHTADTRINPPANLGSETTVHTERVPHRLNPQSRK